jgi:hypothetical protein
VTATIVDLRFTDTGGRQQVVYAVIRDSGVWDVRGIVGGRPFAAECDGWQAVERTILRLRRHAHEPGMAWPRLTGPVAAAIGFLVLLGSAGAALAQPAAPSSPVVQSFVEATREYAALHRRLEANLPSLDVTSRPETIYRVAQVMADALRAARPGARSGDLFTEPVAAELRARIADALSAHGFTAADVLASEAAEGIDGAVAPLYVNGHFPWRYASATLPCIVNALPPLPPELQYRIVGNTLVLIDLHADLIVDVMPSALIATER